MNSDLFKVNWWDIGKATLTVIAGSVITALYKIIETGAIPDWAGLKAILWVGLIAGLSSLLRRFLTNSDGSTVTKEPDVIK